MKKMIMILILCISLFVTGVTAQSVVTLEGTESPYDLVYLSSDPTEIRAFQMYLQCDENIVITKAQGVDPFQIFSRDTDNNGIFRISGFTMESPGQNVKTTFAKIFTSGSGNIAISVEVLSDFDRQKVIPENQDKSYLIFSPTPVITATATQTSQSASQTQTTPYQTPVMTSTSVQEETSTPVNTVVPLSASSPVQTSNPAPTPTKSSLGIACSLLGLAGVFIILKRQKN